ncbi:hypothetical protein ACQUQU_18220 [Thalassolituus sp. LLYu03]|uniref:hypothetical protein n=1 Tax=Thalassolituus sp. LLYu03 TaxID=3421656 RepID=UPI003D2C257B
MHYQRFHQVWASEKANRIADWLIFVAEVQHGHGLAGYLGVSPTVDNHSAVRIWVQKKMRAWPPEFQTLGDLRKAFVAQLPSEYFG